MAYEQFRKADNMTDSMAALSTLANFDTAERQRALDAFYDKWKDEPLVVDKWLAVQAGSRLPTTLNTVKRLLGAPRVRPQGAEQGVRADPHLRRQPRALPRRRRRRLRLPRRPGDRLERAQPAGRRPHVARLRPLAQVRRKRQEKAKAALERIRDAKGLSKDVAEIVGKALA
jgi:aminopeptidase N